MDHDRLKLLEGVEHLHDEKMDYDEPSSVWWGDRHDIYNLARVRQQGNGLECLLSLTAC